MGYEKSMEQLNELKRDAQAIDAAISAVAKRHGRVNMGDFAPLRRDMIASGMHPDAADKLIAGVKDSRNEFSRAFGAASTACDLMAAEIDSAMADVEEFKRHRDRLARQ